MSTKTVLRPSGVMAVEDAVVATFPKHINARMVALHRISTVGGPVLGTVEFTLMPGYELRETRNANDDATVFSWQPESPHG